MQKLNILISFRFIVYLSQGKTGKRKPGRNLTNYNCEKENCISEVQNVHPKTSLNYSDLARGHNLTHANGKN